MKDCIFCKIANNEIPSNKVYEGDKVIAFLDISPIHKGHVLVVPKKHSTNILDIEEEDLIACIKIIKKLSKSVMNGANASGFNIGMNNFSSAGQIVMHSHFHIIPRHDNDGLKNWPNKNYEENEIQDYREKIMEDINNA